ncbi:hypothetical protein [Haliangium ochraceum]|uniref:Uncharacterized protein n=1 Tax=Haliangium ochraceum (strain DSM 14365 / JCM 11303 / SMP-2) TaxID=502025 RepID=D0LSY4_HALO1|nr:hypothetical protein [Haliangium ochraceum]ACY19120.1 conserved hypothetical protein [Haliangium ochraceum DSM 14365]
MVQPRRYIWSEYVPYETLRQRALLEMLRARAIAPLIAVTPPLLGGIASVVRACRDADVTVGVWPMLDDVDGRWASAVNAARFCGFARDLLVTLERADALPDALAIDLEPPIERMRHLLGGRLIPPPPGRGSDAASRYRALVAELAARGIEVFAAAVPPAIFHRASTRRGWQEFLETPLDEIPFARVSAMLYSTLAEGYSRGVIQRADARALLALFAGEARRHLGTRTSISLGCVGTGALGDERVFRSVAELADDVAIARAAGADDIALFNLDGALARPPTEAWLDALVHTPAAGALPPITWRARLLARALGAVGIGASLTLRPPARLSKWRWQRRERERE